VENTNDDECRVLARTIIRDIHRSATMSPANYRRLFGSFDAAKDRVCEEPMPTHMVTEHIKSIFAGLRVARFKADEFRSDQGNGGSDGGGPGATQNEDVAEEDDTAGLDTDVVRIQRFACLSLASRDRAYMFLASFEEFATLPDVQTLFGTVSLVLTDLSYNTRREAGARNSEHDRFSLSDMQKAVDIIERLLRPYGYAFIFCTYQQSADWRNALKSGGIFRLHRINAVEYAWHAHKDKRSVDAAADDAADATATNYAYRATVGFGNGDIDLCSGSSMSPYVDVIDRYTRRAVASLSVRTRRSYERSRNLSSSFATSSACSPLIRPT
jgi:hypothetical protein